MESKHTKGNMRVGKVLNTRTTMMWSKSERDRMDVSEATSVYVDFSEIDDGRGRRRVATTDIQYSVEEAKANAQLICDAFNVTNETGMTPRELQKSHAELLEALKFVSNNLLKWRYGHVTVSLKSVCDKAISNATPKP